MSPGCRGLQDAGHRRLHCSLAGTMMATDWPGVCGVGIGPGHAIRRRTWMLSSVTRLPLPARTPPLQFDTSDRLPVPNASPTAARVVVSPLGSTDASETPRRSTGACGGPRTSLTHDDR